jgi:hypothetical protein
MKFRPTTSCQQIWRWRDRARKKTHITPAQPPKMRKKPEAAHIEFVFIELGVIAS